MQKTAGQRLKIGGLARFAILCTLFASVSHQPAWAYLNPGDGSLLIQAAYAFFASIAGIAGLYWRRFRDTIMRFFPSSSSRPKSQD
jgi:hypothetical protein